MRALEKFKDSFIFLWFRKCCINEDTQKNSKIHISKSLCFREYFSRKVIRKRDFRDNMPQLVQGLYEKLGKYLEDEEHVLLI